MMNRRSFVGALGASVAGAAQSPIQFAFSNFQFPISNPTRLKRVGLELYSVRDAMKADPEATLAKVKAIGYDDVELLWSFNNFGRTPQQVRASLEHEGLSAPSAHIAPEILLKDWDKSLDTARYLGHQYLIVPSLPAETNKSIDAWLRWTETFNNAGAMANKVGVWLAFHNEPDHQKPIGGQIPYDLFIERTDPSVVRLQLDVGNMTMGGGDPFKYLQKFKARYHSFHIKDVLASRKSDTELGAGMFDIKRFLAAVPDVNNKACYVEQEGPADPLASAAKNCAYLKGLEF
jgi:sugar phosphate isomerase/epimerase